jgi:hypothetical protein
MVVAAQEAAGITKLPRVDEVLRRCSTLNSSIPLLRFTSGTRSYLNTGKRWLVRELSKNRRRTEVSVSFSGSAGAVGRHDNTPNRAAIRAGAV